MFLAGRTVAMATYRVTKLITTCLPTIGQFFDTMIVALIGHDSSMAPRLSIPKRELNTKKTTLNIEV